ncbi:MAG TPA: hypothetical protein VEY89_02435 [Candidatus Dormibacteraeota bacterium]|nr:hypothetical protein [Candidatus Dormibacteraeota bacterium]
MSTTATVLGTAVRSGKCECELSVCVTDATSRTTARVSVPIDLASLGRQLGSKAMRNRTHKSRMASSAVRAVAHSFESL